MYGETSDEVDRKKIEINTLKARINELEERNSYLQHRIRILEAEKTSIAKYPRNPVTPTDVGKAFRERSRAVTKNHAYLDDMRRG